MDRLLRRIVLLLFLATSVGLTSIGCGEGTVASDGPRGGEDDGEGTRPQQSDDFFMVPDGGTSRAANITESIPLKVFLFSKETGDPVEGQIVEFAIVEQPGSAASVMPGSTTTDADGGAEIELRVGGDEGTVQVRANSPSSNGVVFDVVVEPRETGQLEIELINTGQSVMPVRDIDVRIFTVNDNSCAQFAPLRQRALNELDQVVVPAVTQPVNFDQLGTRQQFVVTAVAYGDRGQIAAGGCIEDVEVRADQTTKRELLLQLVPLNPSGRYDMTSHWDFGEALADSGPVGETIVRILNIFENPGRAIYDEIINLVQATVGGIISGTIDTFLDMTGLDDTFENMINDFIEQNDALRKVRDAGRDLGDVVSNLEVRSELTIGKMASNYEFRGTDNWLGVTLYWRWNCDANSPPDCGAIELVADGNGEIGELGVLSSEWTGRVASFNKLLIDEHAISLRYGRLIIYVLNDVILPEVTDGNAHSLSDAFAYWVGCDRLAASIGDVGALGATITEQQIENFCSNAVGTLFGFADLLVRNLEYDIGMRIGGEATIIETTSDGFVDLIEDGVFEGHMTSQDQGNRSAAISAGWEATRIDGDTGNL